MVACFRLSLADSLYLSLQGEEQEGLRQLPSSIFTRFGIPAP